MTNEFNVIGQRKDDDLHLLVRPANGHWMGVTAVVAPPRGGAPRRDPPPRHRARGRRRGGRPPPSPAAASTWVSRRS